MSCCRRVPVTGSSDLVGPRALTLGSPRPEQAVLKSEDKWVDLVGAMVSGRWQGWPAAWALPKDLARELYFGVAEVLLQSRRTAARESEAIVALSLGLTSLEGEQDATASKFKAQAAK